MNNVAEIRHNLNDSVDKLDAFVGQKLRYFRNKVGWTLTDLGERVGVSHQQIHKYELGITKISASMLYKLAAVFGTTPNTFFEGFDLEKSCDDLVDNPPHISQRKPVRNILLIEDNAADEFLIRNVLTDLNLGLTVFCVHEGMEALRLLRDKVNVANFPRPDLILLDLNLPNMGGLSVLKSIKQDREIQEIPVLVLTSSLNRIDVTNAYRNHASGFISKAFDFDTFKSNLETAISYWVNAAVLPA